MWALDPDLIKSVLLCVFFEMGKFAYWMLSNLRHYCFIDELLYGGLFPDKAFLKTKNAFPYTLIVHPDNSKKERLFPPSLSSDNRNCLLLENLYLPAGVPLKRDFVA